MYTIGIFANISELTTFPFANIKRFADKNFLQHDNYVFSLYTKEQKEVFIADVQTRRFDGIVFSTNTANDITLKEFFESNKKAFSDFVASGGGILILLQYHLAIANSSFDILSSTDFPGLENTPIKTRQNNDDNNAPVAFDPNKVVCKKDSYIFHYPRDVLAAPNKYFYSAMENNKWQTGRSPLFACISYFPDSDFYSIIDYPDNSANNNELHESFCIISRNVRKRVVISTLALDLEENYLLENLITYIAKGEPDVFFRSCGRCNGEQTCDFADLLNNTKIHYTGEKRLKPVTKYEIIDCVRMQQLLGTSSTNDSRIARIPIKQLLPVNSNGQISRTINMSAIRYTCNLGVQYLRTQLKGGKYGSLIGTLSTLRLFKFMGVSLNRVDRESILQYLKSHNKDQKSFDSVKASTVLANNILNLLEYKDDDIVFSSFRTTEILSYDKQVDSEGCKNLEISELAKCLGQDFEPISKLIGHTNEYQLKETLLIVFARILSAKDSGRISWENDCFMTSLMLIVLLKIEKYLLWYDKTYKTNCTIKINIIASYFEEASETSLYSALVSAADSERDRAQMLLGKLSKEKLAKQKAIEELEVLKSERQEFEILENNIRQEKTITIILIFVIISIIALFCIIVLRSNYSSDENLYDFIINLSPLEIILSLAGLIVIPYTIGTLYMRKPSTGKRKKK